MQTDIWNKEFTGLLFDAFTAGKTGTNWAIQQLSHIEAGQWDSEGIVTLKPLDHLVIYSTKQEILWHGKIDPVPLQPSYYRGIPDGWCQNQVSPALWVKWFTSRPELKAHVSRPMKGSEEYLSYIAKNRSVATVIPFPKAKRDAPQSGPPPSIA